MLVAVAVMGVFLRFEDDSVESAKQAMQWNVKIINVSDGIRSDNVDHLLDF
jgi:parafibromin